MFWRIRHWLELRRRRYVLDRALSALVRIRKSEEIDTNLLADLVFGWGNEAWSAEPNYLLAIWRASWRSPGPILECGSGLSTLVAGVAARNGGQTMHCLEHSLDWARHIRRYLGKLDLRNVVVHDTPLRQYEGFDWYSIPDEVPGALGTIICDGPPSSTRGGRYGLMPCISNRVVSETTILLDDMVRPEEKAIAERWAREFGCSVSIAGSVKRPFAIVRCCKDS